MQEKRPFAAMKATCYFQAGHALSCRSRPQQVLDFRLCGRGFEAGETMRMPSLCGYAGVLGGGGVEVRYAGDSNQVIVRLAGGLGNQMFQYAAGRALSIRHSAPLKLDCSFLHFPAKGDTVRIYGLDRFNIQAGMASEQELPAMVVQTINRRRYRGIRRMCASIRLLCSRHPRSAVIEECAARSAGGLEAVRPPCYLAGYWQSERFFSGSAGVILKDFILRSPLSSTHAAMARRIDGSMSVSVHVRRGDYVENPAAKAALGALDVGYYAKAIALVKSRVPAAEFFVFSDDTAWAEENIRRIVPSVTVVQSGAAHEDLALMTMCKHAIIANSSLSWWGAWLNRNPDKIVCAPARWFADESKNSDDRYAQGWLRI